MAEEEQIGKSVGAQAAGGGLSLSAVVFLVFLVLKLTGVEPVASWSWIWVTCPLWAFWAVVLGIVLILFVGFCFLAALAIIFD